MISIGIVGDHDPANANHAATTEALQHAAAKAGIAVCTQWVATDQLDDVAAAIGQFDGLVIAPGSPYRSLDGALMAINHARLRNVPLLGTCGGFQHVVLEYARNVVGFREAQHAEYDPDAPVLFITPLSCSLAGQIMTVRVKEGTTASNAYRRTEVTERYFCNFALNPAYVATIVQCGLAVSGIDQDGEPRILELADHPFFVATLFVPQTSSTPARPHALFVALVEAAADRASVLSTTDPSSQTA